MISKSYLSILFVALVSILLINTRESATWTTEVVASGGGGSIAIDTLINFAVFREGIGIGFAKMI